jgi:transposase
MGYDTKYRQRAVEYRKEGHTIEETLKVFKIGTTTLKTWVKRYDETSSLENKPLNRKHKKIEVSKLKAYVELHPDAYQREMAKEFGCTETAIRKSLKKLGITRKKRQPATVRKMLMK